MVGLTLLDQARAAGLTVFTDGGRLVVRGLRREEALALELLAHKDELMAHLRARARDCLDPFVAEVVALFRGELLAEGDGPDWDDAVSLDGVFEDPILDRGRRGGARGSG